jgi:Na+/H+-translocating membrane pyrophosphatase
MPQQVIDTADVLDAAGNTAKAITKGFSISAAALTVLALFAAYAEVVEARGVTLQISFLDPLVIAGVLLGAMTPPLFSALTMLAVTHNAFDMRESAVSFVRSPYPGWNGSARLQYLCRLSSPRSPFLTGHSCTLSRRAAPRGGALS